jgi:mannose-6-phosphate isomerase-like protein (cupin superfamily)
LKTLFKKLGKILPFTAGDDTQIREVLHPKNDGQDIGYSLAHASLAAGEASKPHRLQGRSETYILQQGSGRAWVEGQSYDMEAGDTLFIPAGAEQYIENTGSEPLTFWCVVCPPWSEETEEVG